MGESQNLEMTSVPTMPRQRRGTFAEISGNRSEERDVNTLARLGKKQQLKRRFGFVALIGFSCTILATWETALALFQQAFENGGPAGLSWGFLIAWFCSTSVYLVLAEMASIAPIAGGQYFWVSILAPRRWSRFLSYLTGWMTTMAWIATVATGMTFVGTIIQGLVILNNDAYVEHAWHGTLLSWSVVAVGVFINTVIAGVLPFLEGVILILHTLGFICILIPLVYLSPTHASASDVFFSALNEGNWPTQGLSFCIGFIGNVGTFVGADAAVHMAEEIDDAASNVPRAILLTLILNGLAGYGMVLAVLFCLTDVEGALNSATGYPFLQVFVDSTGNAGATVMTIIILVVLFCAVTGFVATASRMTWSFARDKGFPFHRWIGRVDPRTSVPVPAVLLVTIIPCLLTLIYIGSPTIYEDVVSLSVSGLYSSYFVPCVLLLWRRTTGKMRAYDSFEYSGSGGAMRFDATESSSSPEGPRDDSEVLSLPLMWGPWKIPGLLGTLNNAFACVYCLFVLFWDFWPQEYPAAAANMNYTVLIWGAALIFAVVWYSVWGHREYKGPLVEREVRDHGAKLSMTA